MGTSAAAGPRSDPLSMSDKAARVENLTSPSVAGSRPAEPRAGPRRRRRRGRAARSAAASPGPAAGVRRAARAARARWPCGRATTSSTRSRPAGVRRTITLRRSRAPARSTKPRSSSRSMRLVIAPVVTIDWRDQLAGRQLVGLAPTAAAWPARRTSSSRCRSGRSSRPAGGRSAATAATPGRPRSIGETSTSGRTAAHCSTIRSTASRGVPGPLSPIASRRDRLTVIILTLR